MKKYILLFIIVIAVFFASYESIFSFFVKKEENVLAKVNGESVTLEEVETLYDMRNVHLNTPAPDVDKIQQEYAKILYNRIKQILISQELVKRKVKVAESEVVALENMIKESYAEVLSDNLTFEAYLAQNGIDYVEWIKQIYCQLENDKLQALLLEEITLSSEETMQYAEKIKNQKQDDFESIHFFMLKGNTQLLQEIANDTEFTKDKFVQNSFSDERFVEYFEKKGVLVFQSLFDSENLPQQYKSVLTGMEENTFSDILQEDDSSYILYLVRKKPVKQEDVVDLYLIAEEHLLQEKLPQVFNEWLAKAIKESDIVIVDAFNPREMQKSYDTNKIDKLHDMLLKIEN